LDDAFAYAICAFAVAVIYAALTRSPRNGRLSIPDEMTADFA
jgi:hypothetical protein